MNEFIKVSLRADSSNFEKGFAAASGAVGGFRKTLHGIRAIGSEVDNTLKGIGVRAAGMSAAFTAANIANTKSAMDFETAMRNVNSIQQEAEEQFRSTRAQILNMSREMPQAATTMADGLYDIASSGFQGAEALEILEQANIAATAGMTNTAVASQGITAILNAYGLSAGDAADVSDILFKTVDVGVITFEQLVMQLGDFIPLGQAVNATIEEQSAAMAALTRAGFMAPQAATALTGAMRAFVKPSEAMTEQLRELGYESGAMAIEQLGLQGAIEAVTNAVDDDQAAIAQLFQDTEGLRGVLSLTANEGALFSEAMESIGTRANRAGAAQDAYAEQSKALSVQVQLMKNNFTAARIEIGQYYLPILGKVVGFTSDAVGVFGDLPGPVKAGVAAFMALAQVGTLVGAMLLLSTVRARLLRRGVAEVSREYPRLGAAMGRVVGNGRSMITMTARLGRELIRGSRVLNVISAGQGRFANAVNRTRRPVGALASALDRLSRGTTRGNRETGRFTLMISRAAAAMTRYSTATSTAGTRTGRWAAQAQRAGQAASRMARGANLMARGSRVAAGALSIGISALVGFRAAADAGRQAAEQMFDEITADHDMDSLTGQQSALDDLMGKYDELQSKVRGSNDLWGGVMGGLQALDPTGILGDNILEDAHAYGELIDMMEQLQGNIARSNDVLNLWQHATGLSREEAEDLAKTLGIDLTKGVNETEIALYNAWAAGKMSNEEFAEGIRLAGGLGGEMLTASDAAEQGTTNLTRLGEQLKNIRSPINDVTGDTVELTDAQKALQGALESVGSATSGWQEALTGKKEGRQREIEAEISRLEDISEARIDAVEDEVDSLKSGSEARERAQRGLEDLRKREADILEQRREDLRATAEEIKLTLSEYAAALEEQNSRIVNFQANMVTVTSRLGAIYGDALSAEQVTRALATMGDDGVEILAQMASASDEETKRLADAVLKNLELTGDESSVILDAGLTTAAQVGSAGAKGIKDGILNELGLLPDDARMIIGKFGQQIEDGMNQIITGLGGEPIEITSVVGTGTHYGVKTVGTSTGNTQPSTTSSNTGWGGSWGRRRNFMGGFIPEGESSIVAELGTGGEWALPVRGDKMRQKELWMRAGRSMGLLPGGGLMGFSGGGTITHDNRSTRIEKHAPTTFSGPIYANDPNSILAYAERRKRMATLRGGG